MPPHLCGVATKRPPSADLPLIFARNPAAREVAAIPLKPPPGVTWMDPSLGPPDRQGSTCFDSKIIERAVWRAFRQLRLREPRSRKLVTAISHVDAAKDAQLEHFSGRQVRHKSGVELSAFARGKLVAIILLHQVIDDHQSVLKLHRSGLRIEPPDPQIAIGRET